MIQPLLLAGTPDKPDVNLDPEQNRFEISGKSLPENAKSFYDPVIEWLENYAKEPNELTQFNIKLSYFNSSSARKIVELLLILEQIIENGRETKIIWHHKEHDETMKERGTEIQMVLDVPFEMAPY